MSIWAFRRKRDPYGTIINYKARLCAHGGNQVWGENYWETYAPVVHCLSIRTMLAISIIHKLQSRSVDFTLAFPQADLDKLVYMPTRDYCVFLGHKMIVIIYVDDCLTFTPSGSSTAERLIESLQKGHENVKFTDQ